MEIRNRLFAGDEPMDAEIESMDDMSQEVACGDMSDVMSEDAMAMEEEVESAYTAVLAARGLVSDNFASKKAKRGLVSSVPQIKERVANALNTHERASNMIDRASKRVSTVARLVKKLNRAKASTRDSLIVRARDIERRAREASDKYVEIGKMIPDMKKKLAYLFDQEDQVETNTKDYGNYDYETDVKPEHDSDAASTITETQDDATEGWLQQRPSEAIAARKRRMKAGDGNNIRSYEADIPSPGTDADDVTTVLEDDDTSASDIETIMAALMGKMSGRGKKKRKATYNDEAEYTTDTDMQGEVEDMMGEADDSRDPSSEPGAVMGRIKRLLRARRRAEDMDMGSIEEQLEEAVEEALNVDVTLDLAEDDAEVEAADDEEEVPAATARRRMKDRRALWSLVKRLAEEEVEADDEAPAAEETETKEARRRMKNRRSSGGSLISQLKRLLAEEEATDDAGDSEEETTETETKEARRNKNKNRAGVISGKEALAWCKALVRKADMGMLDDGMGMDPMMDDLSMGDPMMDDGIDMSMDDDTYGMEFAADEGDEPADAEVEAEEDAVETGMETEASIRERVRRRNAKFSKAMKLVAMEHQRGLRPDPLIASLIRVLQKDFGVSAGKAELTVRRAMALQNSYEKHIDSLMREADQVMQTYPADKQFLQQFNRIASMNGIHDRAIMASGEEEQEVLSTWETSETYVDAPERFERHASQGGSSVDNILDRPGLFNFRG